MPTSVSLPEVENVRACKNPRAQGVCISLGSQEPDSMIFILSELEKGPGWPTVQKAGTGIANTWSELISALTCYVMRGKWFASCRFNILIYNIG